MNSRSDRARQVRHSAANLAFNRTHPRHVSNGDEQRYRKITVIDPSVAFMSTPSLITSFTKGFCHDNVGFVKNPGTNILDSHRGLQQKVMDTSL